MQILVLVYLCFTAYIPMALTLVVFNDTANHIHKLMQFNVHSATHYMLCSLLRTFEACKTICCLPSLLSMLPSVWRLCNTVARSIVSSTTTSSKESEHSFHMNINFDTLCISLVPAVKKLRLVPLVCLCAYLMWTMLMNIHNNRHLPTARD